MNKLCRVLILLMVSFTSLIMISGNANARSEDNVCSKPKFSGFKPGDRAEVAPGTDFSFRAPASIAVHSVVVTVKGIEVEVTPDDRNDFFYFSGKLPAELKDTFARVKVKGAVLLGCKGTNGWLIKIKGDE